MEKEAVADGHLLLDHRHGCRGHRPRRGRLFWNLSRRIMDDSVQLPRDDIGYVMLNSSGP